MKTKSVIVRSVIAIVLPSMLAACASPGMSPSVGTCRSQGERMGVAEMLSAANACKQVFPQLSDSIDKDIAPIRTSFSHCVAEFDRPGDDRNMMLAGAALSASELSGRPNPKYCQADLRQGVQRLQAWAKSQSAKK